MKNTPQYLYKVLSLDDWNASKSQTTLKLSKMDDEFIHLATEDQLDKIIAKYWSDVTQYVVIKVESKKLPGRLVLEANPGGSNQYFHLYEGSIPRDAIVESNIKSH